MTILDTIIAYKKQEVKKQKEEISYKILEQSEFFSRSIFSMKENLLNSQKNGIIAEFKRQSPSKGIINDKASVKDVTKAYELYGASAVSVLTDNKFFGGNNSDLTEARKAINIPILRKDFIVDEFQIIQAKSLGADCILLIATYLEKSEAKYFAEIAKSFELEVLMEIHTQSELDIVNEFVDIVGVNNRNLKSFEVSLENSLSLIKHIPDEFVKISESGIKNIDDIRTLRNAGFNGFLIGENFMKHENPGEAFVRFVKSI